MKILMSWLREYIDIQVPPEKIADGLLMAGIEVESIHQPGKGIKRVVAGQILSKDKHPNADKLTVCRVDVGAGEPLTIVCGAPNVEVGAKVPVAQVGASLPSGFEISRAKIRGVESFGMMCSRKELGISDDHSGLYLLDPETKLGEDIVKVLGMDDVVFEISVTPNRGDALSHLGIARDLSAIFNLPLHRNPLEKCDGVDDIRQLTSVTMDAPDLCPRYGARLVRDVTVGESPRWLKERLEKIGLRAINNVVDITNYVMMDIGHPMHAFDFDKLEEKRIIVRPARTWEKMVSLDGLDRQLDPSMLVIADGKKPVAIAGVMGGEESSVTATTRNILLEAAFFEPVTVRKTARTLGMMSDSSYRFERGTNIDNLPIALNRAAKLLQDLAGGTPVAGWIDAYPTPRPLRRIPLRARRVGKVLGIELRPEQIETLLLRLKLEVSREGEELWIGVPPFRHDIETEVDVIEEIARLYGYNHIPSTLPSIPSAPRPATPLQKLDRRLRDHLVSLGMHQIVTYSFIPQRTPEILVEGEPLVLKNPLSEEQANLRTSLLYGMVDALRRNVLNDEYDLRFFEIGRVFHRMPAGMCRESDRLCLGVTGPANPLDWKRSRERFHLFQVKGLVSGIGRLAGQELQFQPSQHPGFHPTYQFEIRCREQSIGHLGQVHPSLLDNKKLPADMFLAELDLGLLTEAKRSIPQMKAIPEFPPIRRDLAFVLPLTITCAEIGKIIREEGGPLLESHQLFDIYQGKGIEKDKRSMAFALSFRANDRTLTDEEVLPRVQAMVQRIEGQLHGKLRE